MEYNNEVTSYPALSRRFGSIMIDSVLLIVVMFLLSDVLEAVIPVDDENEGLVRGLSFLVLWGLYEPVAMSLGGTLGNYLVGVKVRRHSDTGKKINIVQAFGRFAIKVSLGWLSFISIGLNKERRAIHDLASGSLMLERTKK